MRRATLILLLSTVLTASASAAVFQYSIPVETERGPKSAFLWLPPQAMRIRGVIIGGMTLMEREFAKDAVIRRACADEGLAIVFLKCGLGRVDVQKVLDDFAGTCAYRELSAAPLMFVGHSAGGPPAKALASQMSDRCFGLVQYRGGVPGGSEPVPPGVPALMMIGQFDEFGGTMRTKTGREAWMGGRDAMIAFRKSNPANLGSIVVEPGAGHFAWSDRNARYLAMFIRKAARACIPAELPEASRPVPVKKIDYEQGWLTDLAIESDDARAPAAFDDYTGDKRIAAWHFDEELARATAAYHDEGFEKKDQFIKWNDPYWVDAGTRFFFTRLEWVGDGRTFEVHPEYAEVYPSRHKGRGPKWLRAGEPVGHSDAPIFVRQVSGPVTAAGPDTLRMKYDGLAPATERSRVTFMACSSGDKTYRYTEQVGMMPRGFSGLKKGKDQTITFPPVGNIKAGSPPVPLKATSDSGLCVEYYVAHGPAKITDGKLAIAELPARAKFPIEIKVVAYQFGSGVEPPVKTAEPVEQTIQLVKP